MLEIQSAKVSLSQRRLARGKEKLMEVDRWGERAKGQSLSWSDAEGLGSASVSLAVFGVSPNTSWRAEQLFLS
jgi:hypothetical protein